jgi:hypothetical protein
MGDENQRRSRRLQGLEPESPPSPGDYIPIEPHMEEEEIHSEAGSIPQVEEHVEGQIKTISEGPIPPFNPPFTNMDDPVMWDITAPHTRYHRFVPHIEEITIELENVMPFT